MTTEAYIQYIWQHSLYSEKSLRTTCGQDLEILNPGEHNTHAGPDFFNARIRLDHMVWAGNVEVHLFASQWNIHGHHRNPAYDNVILHVVHHFDLHIKNSKGRCIPSLIINPFSLPASNLENPGISENWLHCHPHIGDISAMALNPWFRQLYHERLNQKVNHINHIINRFPGNREKALLVALASGFGLPINRLPFEMLASGIPLSLLKEIKDCLPNVEALLFGQSGLLHANSIQGSYASSLKQRYAHLKKAVASNPLPPHLWKFLRIRPASFPTLRLSQFASLIHMHFPLYENLMNSHTIFELEPKLYLESSSYWNTHYIFGKSSPYLIKKMGKQSILHLCINVFIPFMGAIHRPEDIEILYKLTAESNHIIKKWSNFGIIPNNALESQALIQLYNAYCKQKRCVDCQIGQMKPSCSP
jgi:hypothetical protein